MIVLCPVQLECAATCLIVVQNVCNHKTARATMNMTKTHGRLVKYSSFPYKLAVAGSGNVANSPPPWWNPQRMYLMGLEQSVNRDASRGRV